MLSGTTLSETGFGLDVLQPHICDIIMLRWEPAWEHKKVWFGNLWVHDGSDLGTAGYAWEPLGTIGNLLGNTKSFGLGTFLSHLGTDLGTAG